LPVTLANRRCSDHDEVKNLAVWLACIMPWTEFDLACMGRALELAARGQGSVEPNPMVGCVLVRDGREIAAGWHERFGGPHAEAAAIAAGGAANLAGATAYVTLEPCCHQDKTPPCAEALIRAGVSRVVAAMRDPFPQVAGGGIRRLTEAGIQVDVGCREDEARRLNAPYLKLVEQKRPWIIAKWAMSLDGKLAARSGYSRWISGEESRAIVHRLRGRVDAILVGSRTAAMDDPLLTARPAGPRVATRIVVDSRAQLSWQSQLVRTAAKIPVLVAAGPEAGERNTVRLRQLGCEVLPLNAATRYERMLQLLDELGRRCVTNVLVEGGAQVLGGLFDAGQINEVHVFIAPKLIGGARAASPIGGAGLDRVPELSQLIEPVVEQVGDDVYIRGRIGSPTR
jgi:diaminohydroxyphosphoribosylaminopyrimidine deaminase/5-amino-6-(5-phosphoribosylamino)uracil reductase